MKVGLPGGYGSSSQNFLARFRMYCRQNTKTIWISGFVLFFLFLVVLCLPREVVYRDKEKGYQLTVPANWKLKISRDKKTLVLSRRQGKTAGKAEIKVELELGNPYGKNGFDFVFNGMYPRLSYQHEGQTVKLQDYPYTKNRNGIEWGVIAYTVDLEDLYVIYATYENEYLYQVRMLGSGKNQLEAEKDFYEIINSFHLEKLPRTNVFLDKEANTLFEHPL